VPTRRDEYVYGNNWNVVHEGYFSDPNAARPLIAAIRRTIGNATTVVDLGGGTGFVLEELLRAGVPEMFRLVNLDASPAQLAALNHDHIERLHKGVEEFRRADLRARGPVLFVMRSVLHYAGCDGLLPLLRHLRRQMRPGERFVHQTVCFPRRGEADLANRVYALMATGKWLPTVREMRRELAEAGLPVKSAGDAPPLPLSVAELTRRYRLSAQTSASVRAVFAGWRTPALPYKILVCVAE